MCAFMCMRARALSCVQVCVRTGVREHIDIILILCYIHGVLSCLFILIIGC